MNEEEKGFVIKDRRSFDEKGDLKDENKRKPDGKEIRDDAETKAQKEDTKPPPLPEVNFTSLIFSLSSSALLHFGEIADPSTGEKKTDIPLAKNAIDTIAMLKEKTSGNLLEDEQRFLDIVLTDLRWRYVEAAK